MKKFVGIIVATVLAFSLVGCGPVDSAIQNIASSGSNTSSKSGVVTADDDGYAEGRMGDVMRTYFFDYTVNSAYTCNDYEGYTPSEGNKLLVAEITVKNTDRSTVTMYDTDFQIQWGDDDNDDAYAAPITYYGNTVSDEQLPEEYDLGVNEEKTGRWYLKYRKIPRIIPFLIWSSSPMTLREMYSLYSLLQRISKRKQISKTGGFACKKEPEYCGSQCSGSFLPVYF